MLFSQEQKHPAHFFRRQWDSRYTEEFYAGKQHVYLDMCKMNERREGSWQKEMLEEIGQSSLPSMLLLKVCATFIWVDNELVIISTEGLDSFYAPHHQLAMLNSTCVYAAQM